MDLGNIYQPFSYMLSTNSHQERFLGCSGVTNKAYILLDD